MYVPTKFQLSEDDAWRVVGDAGAAALVLNTTNGLESAFAPVVVSEDRRRLCAHVARANPWWRALNPGDDVLALFVAASAYVSPLEYPSRFENPNVVPTWNYVLVQIRGRAYINDDAQWKRDQVQTMTHQFERSRDPEWRVEEMDEEFRASQLRAIVGVQIDVVAVEGKAKLSQNRPDVDRRSVQEHLAQGTLTERNTAEWMKSVE